MSKHPIVKHETFICPKDGTHGLCGDHLVEGENFVGVVDGATPKGSFQWDGMRSDVFASSVLTEAILQLDPDADGPSAIREINEALHRQYALHGLDFDTMPSEERFQASAVIYSLARREIWSFGDCMFRINGKNYQYTKKGDDLLSDLRAFCFEAAKLQNLELGDRDYGREQILPFLRMATLFANQESPFGYDVLNGGPIHPEHVRIHTLKPGDEVVLASDGYPELFDTLAETEANLQRVLPLDPMCLGVLRSTKGMKPGNVSYDDRSYIRFTVG